MCGKLFSRPTGREAGPFTPATRRAEQGGTTPSQPKDAPRRVPNSGPTTPRGSTYLVRNVYHLRQPAHQKLVVPHSHVAGHLGEESLHARSPFSPHGTRPWCAPPP